MNFTDIFIRRPVLATVTSLIILLLGIISFTKLTVRQYPKIDDTTISITTNYSGASAKLMESFVTNPLENAISGIDGIDYIDSQSMQGVSYITIHFKLGYDINTAASDVSNKVQSARWELPSDIDDPVVAKRDPNSNPTLFIGFTSDTMNAAAITDYISRVIQPQLGTLPGVGQAQIYGDQRYAMRIWLNPNLMAARNITVNDVSTALSNNNQQSPTGYVKSDLSQLNVNATTSINTANQFNNLAIKNVDGSLVKIKDIGNAELGAENTDSSVIINGKNAVVMAITPQPTANPLDVSKIVKTTLNKMNDQLPPGLSMRIDWDSSKFIAASIKEVKKTIFEAAAAVILVMFIFLGSLRILAIPTVTIPLSIIGVCSLLLLMGFSINTLTLLALVLAIGMVVDDSIVVSENIYRHIENGMKPLDAALIGAREIRFAIIAMTLTLAAVYAPIGFLTDITGALFKEFAFTLASAVIISGFIALTLSPMMCSKIMRSGTKHNKFQTSIDIGFKKLISGYQFLLKWALHNLKWIGLIFVFIITAVIFLYKDLPQELAPAEDMGAILTSITGPSSANLNYLQRYTKQLEPIFNSVPEKEGYVIINGSDSLSSGLSFLILKPWEERKRKLPAIIQSIFPQLWAIPGIQAFAVNPFRLPGSNEFMPVNFTLKTTGSYEQLAKVMNQLLNMANQNPHLVNVSSNLKFDQPQLNINIDRNKAADLGIPISEIGNTINIAMGEPTVGHFEMDGVSYDVIPQLLPIYMNQPDTIANLNVRTQSGELVPLGNLIKIEEMTTPETLTHFQQQRSATLTASLTPGYSLGQALDFLQSSAKKIMPSTMSYDFGGTSRQFFQASQSGTTTFIFALVFIFLILAAQFESFLDPFIVMLSVIPAIAGALLALKITGGTINIYTQIGLVTLIGLISKHGILMVEFANQQREQGNSIMDAIIAAAVIRFRPILMTTLAMVLGAIPLALAGGAGAISRQQIGWVICGGLLFGTCVTLFVVPSAYVIINKLFAKKSALTIPSSLLQNDETL